MTIHYSNTFEDLLAFARHHYNSSDVVQRNVNVQRYGGVAILLGYFCGIGVFSGSLFYVFAGIVTAIAWHEWIPRVLSSSYERQAARTYASASNRTALGKHRLTVTKGYLEEINEFGESKTTWPAVEQIVTTDECTFLYLGSNHAHIIPKARVAEGDYQQFVEAARKACKKPE